MLFLKTTPTYTSTAALALALTQLLSPLLLSLVTQFRNVIKNFLSGVAKSVSTHKLPQRRQPVPPAKPSPHRTHSFTYLLSLLLHTIVSQSVSYWPARLVVCNEKASFVQQRRRRRWHRQLTLTAASLREFNLWIHLCSAAPNAYIHTCFLRFYANFFVSIVFVLSYHLHLLAVCSCSCSCSRSYNCSCSWLVYELVKAIKNYVWRSFEWHASGLIKCKSWHGRLSWFVA